MDYITVSYTAISKGGIGQNTFILNSILGTILKFIIENINKLVFLTWINVYSEPFDKVHIGWYR
jgi:hypothetical protein